MPYLLASWVALSAFSGMSCDRPPETPADPNAPRYGGEVVIGNNTRPEGLNPLLTSSTVAVNMFPLLFNGLTRLDAKLQPVPDLAESWEIDPDGCAYTFHLRQGIKFHDGVELTADDVKFTYDTARRLNDPRVSRLEQVEAVDRYTVRIVLSQITPRFLTGPATVNIVPKHLLAEGSLDSLPFNRSPVGTGPFRFDAWIDSTRIAFTANKDYYGGRPYLDRVIFWTGLDEAKLFTHLMREEIDVTPTLKPEDMELVRVDSTTFRLINNALVLFYYTLTYNNRRPVFSDRRVRLAFSLALDKQAIIDRALPGYGVIANGPFLPDSWAANPDAPPVPYHPEDALRLLNEAGWKAGSGDHRLRKQGQPLKVSLLVDRGDKTKELVALVIRQQLQEIGVEIRLERVETPLFLEKLRTGAFDMALIQYNAGQDPATASLFFHTKYVDQFNFTGYHNARIDSLFDAGDRTLDPQERQVIYHTIHAMLAEDQPLAFLFFKRRFGAVNRRLEGLGNPAGFGTYQNIHQWYLLPQPVNPSQGGSR